MKRAQRAVKNEVWEQAEEIQAEDSEHIEALQEMKQRINRVGVEDPQEHVPEPPDLDPDKETAHANGL